MEAGSFFQEGCDIASWRFFEVATRYELVARDYSKLEAEQAVCGRADVDIVCSDMIRNPRKVVREDLQRGEDGSNRCSVTYQASRSRGVGGGGPVKKGVSTREL